VITNKLISKVLPFILKEMWKAITPELAPLRKYVNEPNELDLEVKALRKKIKRIERIIGAQAKTYKQDK
tara:strand:+ start:4658 stop:4864 length:207 start_codon:yes stop_codon:yes gene_type:complete